MSAPLHARISEQLQRQIAAGDYPPGAKLPSERQLMAQFGVSRITVRRAIANLVNQGLASAQQGKGVFVSARRKVTHSLSNPLVFLADDMARQGIALTMQNLVFELAIAPAPVQQALKLSEVLPQAYLQKKLFFLDGAIGALDITYLVPDLGAALVAELPAHMTFPTLERHNVRIERLAVQLECRRADAEVARHLAVALGEPLLVYRYTAYAAGERAILQGESISQADRFCYALEIWRSPSLGASQRSTLTEACD